MRDKFVGYIPLSEKELKELWANGTFVLDANVLLNLYRYSEETAEEFLEVLTSFQDRLWLPHQAALEFLRNRASVIVTQTVAYEKLNRFLRDKIEDIKQAKEWNDIAKHPKLKKDELVEQLEKAFDDINALLTKEAEDHPNLIDDDTTLLKVLELFAGKTGDALTEEELSKLYAEGKKRYEQKIPPGYEDAKSKDFPDQYGDLVLWEQTIRFAQGQKQPKGASKLKKPVVVLTDDSKEDWWQIKSGRTIGPRPELLQEMWERANVRCHIYRPEQFLRFAKKYGNQDVKPETVEEVKALSLPVAALAHTALTSPKIAAAALGALAGLAYLKRDDLKTMLANLAKTIEIAHPVGPVQFEVSSPTQEERNMRLLEILELMKKNKEPDPED